MNWEEQGVLALEQRLIWRNQDSEAYAWHDWISLKRWESLLLKTSLYPWPALNSGSGWGCSTACPRLNLGRVLEVVFLMSCWCWEPNTNNLQLSRKFKWHEIRGHSSRGSDGTTCRNRHHQDFSTHQSLSFTVYYNTDILMWHSAQLLDVYVCEMNL